MSKGIIIFKYDFLLLLLFENQLGGMTIMLLRFILFSYAQDHIISGTDPGLSLTPHLNNKILLISDRN